LNILYVIHKLATLLPFIIFLIVIFLVNVFHYEYYNLIVLALLFGFFVFTIISFREEWFIIIQLNDIEFVELQ